MKLEIPLSAIASGSAQFFFCRGIGESADFFNINRHAVAGLQPLTWFLRHARAVRRYEKQ
ncbi:MAG TPA: hypothetical protein VGR14_20730 [Verrucomicrobiae bacterium]|nr:hypothetical protein [Verrucomicrobiae bacterium]